MPDFEVNPPGTRKLLGQALALAYRLTNTSEEWMDTERVFAQAERLGIRTPDHDTPVGEILDELPPDTSDVWDKDGNLKLRVLP